ncbi:MAG: sugar porter family MFS transporter [Isosphaeraceae bacterium]
MLAAPDDRVPVLDGEPPTDSDRDASFNLGWIWTISLVAALGGLLFGYDWVVIGGAKPFYEKYFHLQTPWEVGWAMSCALIGCLGGAVLSGMLADRFGRKRLLILSAAIFTLSAIGTALAGSFGVFVLNRLAGGVAIGLASNLSPLYIAEVAPAAIRGKLVSVNQLTIVIGILMAQVINWLIAEPVAAGATPAEILASWNGQTGWRWMFGVTAVPAAIFFVAMFLVPESPRWLAKAGREDRSLRILERIGGEDYAGRALAEIRQTLKGSSDGSSGGLAEALDRRVRPAVALGVVLAVFQQWCGINVIFNYAEEIFAAAGYGVSDILLNIVITGVVTLIFTFVAIATVDHLGRRFLMLAGAGGLAAIYLLIGLSYATGTRGTAVLLLVVAAIACYGCTLAPVTWVVLSEIFPNRVRGTAMALAVFALWAGCFTLTYSFPFLNRAFGPAGTFWIYSAICLLGFLYIRARLPETKGQTLEQIEARLGARME